jgi:predicted esterase
VVESDGLENRYRSNPIEGSNPSLSAQNWASAEIGRQAGLRSPCSQGRVGSSPTSPTSEMRSSGHRPLVSLWITLLIVILVPLSAVRSMAQKQPSRYGGGRTASASVPTPAIATTPTVPALDTAGLWRFSEQRRIGRYKVRLPAAYATSNVRYRLVLLMHGNGNSPQMLLDWFGGLGLDSLIVVAPEAPYTKILETAKTDRGSYAGVADANWAPDSIRGESITLTAEWYEHILDDAEAGLRTDTTGAPLVIGFSQGGYFAHVLNVRSMRRLGGVASICASVYPQYDVISRYVSKPPHLPPMFVAHGLSDAIVPFSVGQSYRRTLETIGASMVFVSFDGGHWPTSAVDVALRNWIMSIIR